MNRNVGLGIAIVVALVMGRLFFEVQRQRAMAEAAAEQNAAEAARQQADQALRRERKVIAEPGQP